MARLTAKKVLADDKGATAIEYSMIAAGIAVAIMTAISTLGTNVTALFTTIAGGFS